MIIVQPPLVDLHSGLHLARSDSLLRSEEAMGNEQGKQTAPTTAGIQSMDESLQKKFSKGIKYNSMWPLASHMPDFWQWLQLITLTVIIT